MFILTEGRDTPKILNESNDTRSQKRNGSENIEGRNVIG